MKENIIKLTEINEYREISLQEGLNQIQLGNINKLFINGLKTYEYIYFDNNNGFCYEDGCIISETFDQTLNVLYSLKRRFSPKFYVKNRNQIRLIIEVN